MNYFHDSSQLRAQQKNIHPEMIKNGKSIGMTSRVGGKSDSRKPMLSIKPNILLKPLQNDHRGLREMVFYELATAAKCIIEDRWYDQQRAKKNWIPWFQSVINWLPLKLYGFTDKKWYMDICHLHKLSDFLVTYHGVIQNVQDDKVDKVQVALIGGHPDSYIILTDETIRFQKPCIMDLKIGTATYEPDAKPSKKESQRKKFPQQEEFGFRIVGLHVYDPNHSKASISTGYCTFDKSEGRQFNTKDAITFAFQSYFKLTTGVETIQRGILKDFLEKLKRLRKWFLENESFAFYASSLLLIYDGAPRDSEKTGITTTLKMIDFAHVRKNNGIDVGYLHGLDVIISIFIDILHFTES